MKTVKLTSNPQIENRLQEFIKLNLDDNKAWFSELCFCILTANSQAQKAIDIQNEIGNDGFINKTEIEIRNIIQKHKHRFHNNKSKYIVEARKFINIKEYVTNFKDSKEARDFIVKNIKGIGFKEASHFLRNVGYHDVAIIDRHILRFMHQQNLIPEIPKTITKKLYLELENKLNIFEIPMDKLDLIIWEKMTGKVLK